MLLVLDLLQFAVSSPICWCAAICILQNLHKYHCWAVWPCLSSSFAYVRYAGEHEASRRLKTGDAGADGGL